LYTERGLHKGRGVKRKVGLGGTGLREGMGVRSWQGSWRGRCFEKKEKGVEEKEGLGWRKHFRGVRKKGFGRGSGCKRLERSWERLML